MPPNHFESEVESFLEGSHGDRTHIKRADHHTVTPLCGTLLALCAKKFALRHCSDRAGAKKFAQHTKNGSKWVVYGALGELLRGNAAGGGAGRVFSRKCGWRGRAGRVLMQRGPGSWAHLLAPLTLQCAAKPYWWRGGQPAQVATSRVNVRIKGPRPPPIGLTCG